MTSPLVSHRLSPTAPAIRTTTTPMMSQRYRRQTERGSSASTFSSSSGSSSVRSTGLSDSTGFSGASIAPVFAMGPVQTVDFTVSRIPAVSPLRVLPKSYLKVQLRALQARLGLQESHQLAHNGLHSGRCTINGGQLSTPSPPTPDGGLPRHHRGGGPPKSVRPGRSRSAASLPAVDRRARHHRGHGRPAGPGPGEGGPRRARFDLTAQFIPRRAGRSVSARRTRFSFVSRPPGVGFLQRKVRPGVPGHWSVPVPPFVMSRR